MSCSDFLRLGCSDPQTDSSLFADMVCIWDFCCSPFEVVPHAVRQSVERRCALRQRGKVRGLLEGLFSLIVGVLQPDALMRLLLTPGVPSPARSWVLPLRAGPFSPTSLSPFSGISFHRQELSIAALIPDGCSQAGVFAQLVIHVSAYRDVTSSMRRTHDHCSRWPELGFVARFAIMQCIMQPVLRQRLDAMH